VTDAAPEPGPKGHRTVDRVTRILEEVAYRPGVGFAELARVVGAPKSSVHGFVRGLQATGWLHQDDDRGFHLGPAISGLTLASGPVRAGRVSQGELDDLAAETGLAVFLGVRAGAHLIYIGESGTDALTGLAARTDIRRELVSTAGGKALLAVLPDGEREAHLRARQPVEPEAVARFRAELADIRRTRLARNYRYRAAQLAVAAVVHDRTGHSVAALTVIGQAADVGPREAEVGAVLLRHVDSWSRRTTPAREAI
jgi:DNA-binding IclR family transcriptional regulator